MLRHRRYLPLAWLLTAPLLALGQAPFDPPPLPTGDVRQPPAVRGLYDPSRAATRPAGPLGAAEAPAATFVAPSAPSSTTPTAPAQQTSLSQAQPIAGGEILARVDDQVILAGDVLWQVNQLVGLIAARQPIPPDQMGPLRKHLLRQQVLGLIETKLLFADFRRTVPAENMPQIEETLGKPFEETEIPRLIKMLKVQDRGELEQLLKASGTSIKDVQRQFMEKQIAGQWLQGRIPKAKPISHEALLAYYNDHLKEYEYPAQARWEEMLVRFDRFKGDRDAAWQALAEMGNEVWAKAAANPGLRGPAFAEVAKAKSHGITAAEGGLRDWTTVGAFKSEALNDALATLAVGQMSDGIESEQGFHIVRVLERKAAGRSTFIEKQAEIRDLLVKEQREALFNAEFAQLRKAAKVWTVFDGELNGTRLAELLDNKQKR